MVLRPLVDDDLDAVLALNNAHAAEVNALTRDELAGLVAIARYARVLAEPDALHAFLIAFDERTPPQGPNHAWFLAREPAFVYIDRVVVAPGSRGRGLARLLYDDLAIEAGAAPLCCEVNLVPANPASLALHERLRFATCGEAVDPRNGKHVRYLKRT